MDVSVEAGKLRDVMKRLAPKARRAALACDSVRVTAGGDALVLLGSYENSASLPAEVRVPGSTTLPLESTLRLLTLCKAKEILRIRSDGEFVWVGSVKFGSR